MTFRTSVWTEVEYAFTEVGETGYVAIVLPSTEVQFGAGPGGESRVEIPFEVLAQYVQHREAQGE
jgi:hypothetical protein